MTLLEEYKKQSNWREWERYLNKLPLNENQIVYDLGCSIGTISKLFALKVKKVVGFDNDKCLLEEAFKEKPDNCEFILENIFTIDTSKLEKCDGIWLSFALDYMEEPNLFVSNWIKCLNYGGWFAIVDIDGLFSSHLSNESEYFDKVELFEKESEQNKLYDFIIGRKIKKIIEQNGLEVITIEDNWYDKELNFKGKTTEEIAKNWTARLERMITLKSYFGGQYHGFCNYFSNVITDEGHITNGGVKYYVGIKKYR